MSGVRVLVGTRKGAFILTADGKRDRWDVSGPHFPGWEIYHLKGSPVEPEPALRVAVERLVRPVDPALGRRRQDVGAGRQQVRVRRRRRAPTSGTTGRQHPWEFARVWHLEPSLTDPDTVYAGVEDAALFRSTDGGADLAGAARAAAARLRPVLAAGRRRHVPAHHPARPVPTRSGCSSRSPPPARSAPTTAARPGSRSTAGSSPRAFPNPDAEVGHCVHRIAMHPSRPDVLFMQKHWDVMRSDDAGDSWQRGEREPAHRLRLPDRRPRPRAGDDLRRADQERLGALPARGQAPRVSGAGPAATSGSR